MKHTSTTYAFIDSQNVHLGIQSLGWKLDFKKLRMYLRNKYNVSEAYLFIGNVPGNERLYNSLSEYGYTLVMKPTVEYKKAGKVTYKGNVDAELVLYAAAKCIGQYDKAIVVSGDGDFACLHEFLEHQDKLAAIITPNRVYSGLQKPFVRYIVRLDRARHSLEYIKNDQHRRSVETLGVADRGDKKTIANPPNKVNRSRR